MSHAASCCVVNSPFIEVIFAPVHIQVELMQLSNYPLSVGRMIVLTTEMTKPPWKPLGSAPIVMANYYV